MSQDLAGENFCYLTAIGRITGKPHTIEIWFEISGHTLYMLSGGGERADWVKNIQRNPQVRVRIGDSSFEGHGRIVDDPYEDALARELLVSKYERGSDDLTRWRERALPVAVDLYV